MVGMLWLVLLGAISVLLLKWLLSWLLSRFFAALLGCRHVSIGRFGLLSLSHLKLDFSQDFKLELDNVRLSSSFFNQEYSKPVVVSIGDLRLDAGPEVVLSSSRGQASVGASSKPRRKIAALLNWLQYGMFHVENAGIVVLDLVIPRCLFHISLEELQLDTYRDKDGIQIEFTCKLINCKLLQRASLDSKGRLAGSSSSTPLIDFSLGLSISAEYDPKEAQQKFLGLMFSDPLLSVSEGLFPIIPTLADKFSTRDPGPAPPDESVPSEHVNQYLPSYKLEIHNLSFRLIRAGEFRLLDLQLKYFYVNLIHELETSLPNVELIFEKLCVQDGPGSSFNVSKCAVDSLVINECWQCKCQIDESSLELAEDSILYWRKYKDETQKYFVKPKDEILIQKSSSGTGLLRKLGNPSFSIEINSFFTRLKPRDEEELDVFVEYISINAKGLRMGEVGVETAWCRRLRNGSRAERHTIDPGSDSHIWNTPLQLRAALVRWKAGTHNSKIQVQLDRWCLEWEPSLLKLAGFVMDRSRAYAPQMEISKKHKTPSKLTLKICATDGTLFLPVRQAASSCVRVDEIRVEHNPTSTIVSVLKTRLFYIEKLNAWIPSVEKLDEKYCSTVPKMKFVHRRPENEISLEVTDGMSVNWSPTVHIALLEVATASKQILQSMKSVPDQSPTKTFQWPHTSLAFQGSPLQITFSLPENKEIKFSGSKFEMEISQGEMGVILPKLNVSFDDRDVFQLDTISIKRLHQHETMTSCRGGIKELHSRTNNVWLVSMDSFSAIFPYNYKFSEAYDKGVDVWKWVKKVHKITRKPYNLDSPLYPDLCFSIKTFVFQLDDDPFEVKLRDNYELLIDEYNESERRREMLETKLSDLRKMNPLLPRANLEDLQRSLIRKNADIYIQRSKQLGPCRKQLFRWEIQGGQLRVAADRSLHGTENVTKLIKSLNPESPWPKEKLEFTTLWARAVELDFDVWRMELRDYPQPYIEILNGHLFGKLAGAEVAGTGRSIRDVTVKLEEPWGGFNIQRNMMPLKFYYDFGFQMENFNMSYGPCWEPCLAMVNLCFNNVNRPSLDPSLPLPFWDKIRLLMHGRLSIMATKFVTIMLASPDPYNTTEQLEFTWENFGFDWQTGIIMVHADVDVFVRAASKYDDICLFHLPSLKMKIKMEWVRLGEPNDHHSVSPCAPDKLPEYSLNQDHDSYRAFRSKHLNLSLKLEMKNTNQDGLNRSDSKCPQMLVYANTVRWLDQLKNTLSAVNRPVKRGALFANPRQKKSQLSRHYRKIELVISLPKFMVSYWMSFSSDHGFRLSSSSLLLTSTHYLTFHRPTDELKRRAQARWSIGKLSVELLTAEITLFIERPSPDHESKSSFFIGLERLTYDREGTRDNSTANIVPPSDGRASSVHHLVLYDLRGLWTNDNRETILAILDGLQKARLLRRNLSTEALKSLQFSAESPRSDSLKPERLSSQMSGGSPPPGRMEGSDGNAMLERLIEEASTKFVAYSEETAERPLDSLYGVALCAADDVQYTRWEIELINGQVALKGCETGGFVLCTAQKAHVKQRVHKPVWREAQVLGKRSWTALLSGMQYYAPFNFDFRSQGDEVRWLPSGLIRDPARSEMSTGIFRNLVADEEAVGGIVTEDMSLDVGQQLQRVISRCSCQVYFCHFGDTFDVDDLDEIPPPPEFGATDFLQKKEYVDCFTLKHNMLNVSTNPLQYQVIMDILSNLLLFVDPKKKESAEKRLRLRFKLQVQSSEDIRPVISDLQNEVRCILARSRQMERQAFFLDRELRGGNHHEREELEAAYKEIEEEAERSKALLTIKCEELGNYISCYKEKLVRQVKQMTRFTEDDLAPIARRFEVCFEDAQWRLTEADGQLGITDLQIRNFMYTKISRINNSGDHCLEVGSVNITNLLPNSKYRDVLQAQHQSGLCADRQPAVRVICREMAPVGGLPVKEHFEINVIPMVAQMTYAYYRAIMNYFFPGRNIDKADQQNLDVEEQGHKGKLAAAKPIGKKKGSGRNLADEIEKMKERAEKNNMFLYIKIPEVSFLVSYKGGKEKNIEDVDNFSISFPLVEYHDRNWTWLDLALAIKQRSKRVLVQQFMKQKLLRNRIMGAGTNTQEVSSLPEEDKIKMLFGDLGLGKEKKGGILSKKS